MCAFIKFASPLTVALACLAGPFLSLMRVSHNSLWIMHLVKGQRAGWIGPLAMMRSWGREREGVGWGAERQKHSRSLPMFCSVMLVKNLGKLAHRFLSLNKQRVHQEIYLSDKVPLDVVVFDFSFWSTVPGFVVQTSCFSCRSVLLLWQRAALYCRDHYADHYAAHSMFMVHFSHSLVQNSQWCCYCCY